MGHYSLKYGSLGSPVEYEEGEPRCYTDEWKRTSPDYVVYLPQEFIGIDTDNVHFLVTQTNAGTLLGVWTQATYEAADNSSVVCARSEDGGETWGSPVEIGGPNDARYNMAFFGFPVVSRAGRIYIFYIKKTLGTWEIDSTRGFMHCRYSDDDGVTWSSPPVDIPVIRREPDDPDPAMPPKWKVWTNTVRDSSGTLAVPVERYTNRRMPLESAHWIDLIRFTNIDDGPEPEDLETTWLPEEPIAPLPLHGIEPSIVLLPNGRLFMALRTGAGSVWYTVSNDPEGRSWRSPEPMLYRDGGERVLNPGSPCPLFHLADGRYLLQYHNNDGSASGGPQPMWSRPYSFSRRSMFIAVGEYRPDAHQPIWFSQGKRIADTDGVSAGVQNRLDCGTYGSLTDIDGRRILWYPDRKHFLLGKEIGDDLLSDMHVPAG